MNKRKYVSNNIDSNAKKLYKLMKLSIATGSVYLMMLITGFTALNKNRTSTSNVDNKNDKEIVYETDDIEIDDVNVLSTSEASEYLDGLGLYKVTSFGPGYENIYNGPKTPYFDIKLTPRDFAKHFNATKLTYDDVRNTVLNNSSLSNEVKNILIEALNTARTKFGNISIPLAALNYNLAHLRIREIYTQTICEFDPYLCCLYINGNLKENKELYKHALIKGVFGHAMLEAYTETDNKRILCSASEWYKYNSDNPYVIKLGTTFENGYAEVITSMLTDGVVDCNSPLVEHGEDAWIFGMFGMFKGSIINYVNYGYEGIIRYYTNPPLARTLPYIIDYDMPKSSINANLNITIKILDMDLDYYNDPETISHKCDMNGHPFYYDEREKAFRSIINDYLTFNDFLIIPSEDKNKVGYNSVMDIMEEHIEKLCNDPAKSK